MLSTYTNLPEYNLRSQPATINHRSYSRQYAFLPSFPPQSSSTRLRIVADVPQPRKTCLHTPSIYFWRMSCKSVQPNSGAPYSKGSKDHPRPRGRSIETAAAKGDPSRGPCEICTTYSTTMRTMLGSRKLGSECFEKPSYSIATPHSAVPCETAPRLRSFRNKTTGFMLFRGPTGPLMKPPSLVLGRLELTSERDARGPGSGG